MRTQLFAAGAALLVLISGCNFSEPSIKQGHLLQATSWYQQSAEMEAIYYQSFNWAKKLLELKVLEPGNKPLAVVLDIDETILDNSPQTAQQIIDGEPFSDLFWDEWCSLASAESLPGAVDFTESALELGVEVFYISNRKIHLLDVTLENMEEAGFPNADSAHVLLKTDTSVKDLRREKVSNTHHIVLLIGDNLGDFSGIFDERNGENTSQLVKENREQFGSEYIILPNPMYGGWEKPFRGEGMEAEQQRKMDALRSFRN